MATSCLLLRVGETKKLKEFYENGKMAFSCPWNWINYCINEGNSTIGDINECPYQVCFDGYAVLNTNKFLLTDFNDQSKMIHRMSTVLTPAYCFFSVDPEWVNNEYEFDICKYCHEMNILNLKGQSFLFILDIDAFKEDLFSSLQAVKTIKGRKFEYDDKKEHIKLVEYKDDIYGPNENEIFIKNRKYEYQHEARIVLPEYTFEKELGYISFELTLKNAKNYSRVVTAKIMSRLKFSRKDGKIMMQTMGQPIIIEGDT